MTLPGKWSAHARAEARLTPTQQRTCDTALDLLMPGTVVTITQGPHNFDRGLGATTLMKAMQLQTGGEYIDVDAVLDLTRLRHPRHFEQSTFEIIRKAAEQSEILYLDRPPHGARRDYNRFDMIGSILRYVADVARTGRKRIVFAGYGTASAVHAAIMTFGAADYAFLFARYLGVEQIKLIDFDQVHDHASFLNGHRIVRICASLRSRGLSQPTTREVIETSAGLMGANIDLSEVEPIAFGSLSGFEKILRRLDRAILLPLREPALARRLGLETKRGVLLHGPPGTGKTSIGRALAHQMQGRFFMIDGDYNHQIRGSFYDATSLIFDMARRCTPSVIFIDDADVILGDPTMQQWGRFLLTKLDGLHSQAASRVCVMMTAMNIHDLPQALLRSGRLEMWIETTLPDRDARRAILHTHIDKLPGADQHIDLPLAAELTEGFTPADLRSVVSDIAGFIAHDRFREDAQKPLDEYFARAVREKSDHKLVVEAINRRSGR